MIRPNSNKCWFYKQATRDRRSTTPAPPRVPRSPPDGLPFALGGLFFPPRFRNRFCLRFLLLSGSQINPQITRKSKKTDFLRSLLLAWVLDTIFKNSQLNSGPRDLEKSAFRLGGVAEITICVFSVTMFLGSFSGTILAPFPFHFVTRKLKKELPKPMPEIY